MGYDISKICSKAPAISESAGVVYDGRITDYFGHYGLDAEADMTEVEHLFGTFESKGRKLAGHIYRPSDYEATVIVLHGYLNHSGQVKNLIKHLLGEGYAVAAFDLPGHGLSEGSRASIDDFAEYSTAMMDFYEVVRGQLDGPYHVVGFSTGASAMIDYLLAGDECVFDKVVMASPLVHSTSWWWARLGYTIYKPFRKSVPRVPRENSSDKEFIEFNRTEDYLHARRVPMEWVGALHKWNKKIKGLGPCDKEMLVLQGNRDKTVDHKYNIPFIKKKFTNAEVHTIDTARHELFNESEKLRSQVFSRIDDYLRHE